MCLSHLGIVSPHSHYPRQGQGGAHNRFHAALRGRCPNAIYYNTRLLSCLRTCFAWPGTCCCHGGAAAAVPCLFTDSLAVPLLSPSRACLDGGMANSRDASAAISVIPLPRTGRHSGDIHTGTLAPYAFLAIAFDYLPLRRHTIVISWRLISLILFHYSAPVGHKTNDVQLSSLCVRTAYHGCLDCFRLYTAPSAFGGSETPLVATAPLSARRWTALLALTAF